jgi:hypothetical protein
MKLADTIEMMNSSDYKERFKAEYYQTKIRYEKLKDFNNHIEAVGCHNYTGDNYRNNVVIPKHDCDFSTLKEQQRVMGEYLHLLEVRAIVEGIELNGTI